MENLKYVFNDGGKKAAYPKTPLRSDDCVIRAITFALEKPYKEVFCDLMDLAKEIGDLPTSNRVSVEYLKRNGWSETKLPKSPLVRVNELGKITNSSKWVILYIRNHWVACQENTLYDLWDSRKNYMGDFKRVFRYYTKD